MGMSQAELDVLALDNSTECTKSLLLAISQRLSSRDDCRDIEYEVIIDATGVRMTPYIEVFPSYKSRKQGDKIDVVSFVHQYKLPNAKLTDFAFGTYKYKKLGYQSINRRWIKET